MSSKVIRWFKRQASIRRFTDKKEEPKTSSGSKEPPEEKRKLSFGRLSFKRKHKRKPSSTTELEGNLAIVGISKKYSYSVPNEMEDEKVINNVTTTAVSLDNSSCTNSPTKTDTTSKSVSDLSYHSSFDNEAHSSEFSREFDNSPSAEATQLLLEKNELDSEEASKFTDTFHTGLNSPSKSIVDQDATICSQFSPVDDHNDLDNPSTCSKLSEEERKYPVEAQRHPPDVRVDKQVIPTIVIENFPNKPPLAVVESYSSDDLSCLSDLEFAEMKKNCGSIESVVESKNEIFKEIDSLVEDAKSASDIHTEVEISPTSEFTNAISDTVLANGEIDAQSLSSYDKSEENVTVRENLEPILVKKTDLEEKLDDDTPLPSSESSSPSTTDIPPLETDTVKVDEPLNTNVAVNIPIISEVPSSEPSQTKSESPTSEFSDSSQTFDNTESLKEINGDSVLPKSLEQNTFKQSESSEVPSVSEEIITLPPSPKVSNRREEPIRVAPIVPPATKVGSLEYPEELNPFGDESEEETPGNNKKIYPSLNGVQENGGNPFGSDTEAEEESNITITNKPLNNLKKYSRQEIKPEPLNNISKAPSKKSLNPFGDSDDEDNEAVNIDNKIMRDDDIPPRLPPKSDLQKRKYSGASLAPIPRPRKTKQYHGSTISLQNISSFGLPVPAPRSITPFGSTRTLNVSTSSMNPFDEDEDDELSNAFDRRGVGRNTVQLESEASEGAGDPFQRSEVRCSLPISARFRPKTKRQAPLPPGAITNKPPMSSSSSGSSLFSRKRSSTSPAADPIFEGRLRSSKSPSPQRNPPPRPPLPKI